MSSKKDIKQISIGSKRVFMKRRKLISAISFMHTKIANVDRNIKIKNAKYLIGYSFVCVQLHVTQNKNRALKLKTSLTNL